MRYTLFTLLFILFAAPSSSAQRIEPDILFSDFDDAPGTYNFGDATVTLVADEGEYATSAMRGTIDPAGGSGFAGFAVFRGALDASAAESVVFLTRSTVTDANASGGRSTVVLEVKLKQGGVEYTALRELAPATGFQFMSIPLEAFRANGGGLDASAVTDVIFAVSGASGPVFTIDVENLGFATSPVTAFNDFDDGDFSTDAFYSFTQSGTGIGRPADGPGADGTANALVISYDGSAAGEFAGFGFGTPGGGTVDVSDTDFFEFMYRDTDDGTVLLVKLVEPGGDEFITSVPLPPGPGDQQIRLPLSSFSDNAGGNGVLDQLQTVAFEILVRGDGPSTVVIDQVTFRAQRTPITQTLSNGAGWRLLSPPVSDFSVADLASQNLVQGISDSYPSRPTNVYTGYTGEPTLGGYTPAASTAEVLTPGNGFYWYSYDQTGPDVPERKPNPFTLFGQGDIATTDVTVTQPLNVGSESSSFHLIGNPFDTPFALSGISETTSGGTFQTSVSIWDPSAKTYRMRTPANLAAVWQGFFAEITNATSDPTFVFSAASRVGPAAPPFYGRMAGGQLAFELRGAVGGVPVTDQAAVVRFVDDAEAGWDRHDASKLSPLTSAFALAAFEGAGPDGAPRRQSVLALPLIGTTETPLLVTSSAEGAFTLSWSGAVPDGMQAELRDASTGTRHDLSVPGQVTVAASPDAWASPLSVVTTSLVVDDEGAANGSDRLGAPSPNPSTGAVRFPVQLAVAQTVRVTTYDVLGRRVATSEAAQPAGASTLRADLTDLAPGVYVVRVEGDTLSASRRVTVRR